MCADIQKLYLSVSQEAMKRACSETDKEALEAKEKIREAGVQFFDVSPVEKAKFDKVFEDVAAEWVRDNSKRNKSSEAVYKAFRAAAAKY